MCIKKLASIFLIIVFCFLFASCSNQPYLWRYKADQWIKPTDRFVANESLIFTYGYSNENIIRCMDLTTGKLRWKHPGRLAIYDQNNTLLIQEKQEGKDNIVAIDLKTGEKKWSRTENSSFTAFKNHFLLVKKDQLISLDSETGNEQWKAEVPLNLQQVKYPNDTFQSLAYDNYYITQLTDLGFQVFDTNSGKLIWSNQEIDFVKTSKNTFTAYRNDLYCIGYNIDKLPTLYAFDLSSGKILWQQVIPTSYDKNIFRILCSDNLVLCCEFKSNELKNGSEINPSFFNAWSHSGEKAWKSSFASIDFIDTLYFFQNLLIYSARTDQKRNMSTLHFFDIATEKDIKQIPSEGNLYDFDYLVDDKLITFQWTNFGKYIVARKVTIGN
jgi:outer membrane protein assembly factor BamB